MTQEVFCVHKCTCFTISKWVWLKREEWKKKIERKSLWEIKPLFYCVYFYYKRKKKKIRSAQKTRDSIFFFFSVCFSSSFMCEFYSFYFTLTRCLSLSLVLSRIRKLEKRLGSMEKRNQTSNSVHNITHTLWIWMNGNMGKETVTSDPLALYRSSRGSYFHFDIMFFFAKLKRTCESVCV